MKKLIPLLLISVLGFCEVAVANDCFQCEEFNSELYQKALVTSAQQKSNVAKTAKYEFITEKLPNNNKIIHGEFDHKNSEIDDNFWQEESGVLELEEIVEIIDEQHKDWRTAKVNIKNISHIDD